METVEDTSIDEVPRDRKLPTIDEFLGDISLVDEMSGDIEVPRAMNEFTDVSHPQQFH